jgi:hypothetical protein
MKTTIFTTSSPIEEFKKQIENIKDFEYGQKLSWGVINGMKSFSVVGSTISDTFDIENEEIFYEKESITIITFSGAKYTLKENCISYEGGAKSIFVHDGVDFLNEIIDEEKTRKESKIISSKWGELPFADYWKLYREEFDKDAADFEYRGLFE